MSEPKISRVRKQIEDNENLLSKASIWEIAIKFTIGKLNFNLSVDEFIKATD